jgi:hypothetical protein
MEVHDCIDNQRVCDPLCWNASDLRFEPLKWHRRRYSRLLTHAVHPYPNSRNEYPQSCQPCQYISTPYLGLRNEHVI